MRFSSATRSWRRARSIATAAKLASAVSRSRSRSVNVPTCSGESTWITPMTESRFQSGAHIAERICCMRIDIPASNRSSTWASDVSTATFCPHHHVHDRPRSTAADPSEVARAATSESADPQLQAALLLEQEESAVDGQVLEDQVHDLLEHRLDVVGRDERLGDLDEDLEDLVLVGDVERRRACGARWTRAPAPRPSRGRSRG